MAKSNHSNIVRIQSLIGFSQGELIIAALILSGLVLGGIIKIFSSDEAGRIEAGSDIYYLLDSLAEARRTTYIGTDLEGNVDEALANEDTIVKKESYFPISKKKEIPAGKININTASLAQLVKLPGVGRKTADKIIAHRLRTPFQSPEDITKIKGIGEKKFDKMKGFISVN